MNIFIYGECNQYGSGAWCYFDTLKNMGHDVSYFSPQTSLEAYSKNFLLKVFRRLQNGAVFEKHRRTHIKEFKKALAAAEPQIVIILKGLLLDRKLIKEIKDNAWVVMINHDDFFSLYATSRSKIQFEAIPEYDFIFPTKEINVCEISTINKNIEFFPFAFNPGIHFPPNYNEADEAEWYSDIVFIGSCYPERRRQLEYLIENLDEPLVIKIYGSNWNKIPRKSILSKHIQYRFLGPEEMRKAIFYSKISLGFLCKENRDDYTQRTFEIPACGGLLLAERTSRHLSYLKEGEEAEFFDQKKYSEMVSKVKFLLSDQELNKKLRHNGMSKISSSGHSYQNRLEMLFNVYYNSRSSPDEYSKSITENY